MSSAGLEPVEDRVQQAEQAAASAAREAAVLVSAADDERTCRLVSEVGDHVWGGGGTFAPNELRALTFSGNPVHLAVDERNGSAVGFAVGFLGWTPDLHVHSHQTGVVTRHRRRGVGYALKLAQRSTCLAYGVDQVRWTFDPLVRRNVAFNLNALGARAVAFHPDFYGAMTDSINASDASDRLEAAWDLTRPLPLAPARAAPEPPAAGSVVLRDRAGWPEPVGTPAAGAVLEVPAGYEEIRAREPARAQAWRLAVRTTLAAAYGAGLRIGAVDERGYRLVAHQEEGDE